MNTGAAPVSRAEASASAVRKGFHVMWALSELERERPGPQALGSIARRAMLSESHTHKILADARALPFEYVTQAGPGKGYQLSASGRRLLGTAPRNHLPQPSSFRSMLEELRDLTGHSALLHYRTTTLDGGLLCTLGDLAVAGDRQVEEQVLDLAFRPDPTRTAAGRVMLASLSASAFERLPAAQQLNVTRVLGIRNLRYEAETHRPPTASGHWRTLAVPLFYNGNDVAGALTLTGPVAHHLSAEEAHLRHLRTVADHIVRIACLGDGT
ncbi:hypothetical protein [Streptomyces sp. NPDC059918]|uniref:hypothetical protein n=1 Tax=unclassified Streptomyces TaxID=2593676 RepID=UPI003648ACE1